VDGIPPAVYRHNKTLESFKAAITKGNEIWEREVIYFSGEVCLTTFKGHKLKLAQTD